MADPAKFSGCSREDMRNECRLYPCQTVEKALRGYRKEVRIPCVLCVHESKLRKAGYV